MNESYTFARFWKCALQVNPVGYNTAYRGSEHGLTEESYNEALLQKCLELDIKVVGLADHGSVESVDTLRGVLEPHGIVVFPGFEISSTEKIHMVCLFPEGTTKVQLNRYLGKLDLTDPDEKVMPSRLGCLELAQIIKNLGGFWYAAHMTGNNGLLRLHQDGGGLTHVWKEQALVRAGQIPGPVEDLPDNYRKIVENKNPDWQRERPIAVINAKDVAKPEDLDHPGATCLIKMTRPTFAAFNVAFLDPESRIRLNSHQPISPIGKLVRLNITGGYLDGVSINFSDHLNTVIGGRGTGKSTLLECLRFALNTPPKGKQARKLHDDIIKENLGKAKGRVELEVISSAQHGKRYRVTRCHGELPIVRDENGNVSNLLPQDLLPGIDIYGQNEIYELAQDDQSRVQLLDRFLPQDGDFARRGAELKKRLFENQTKLSKALMDLDELRTQADRLPKLQEQLAGFQAHGIQEKLAKAPLLTREKAIARQAGEELERVQDSLMAFQESLPDLTFISDKALEGLPDAEKLQPLRNSLQALSISMQQHVEVMQTEFDKVDAVFQTQFEQWKQALLANEAELEKAIRNLPGLAGRSGPEVGVAFQRLMEDIERIKPLDARIATFAKLAEALGQERRNMLADLSDLRSQRRAALQKAAKSLNRRLGGKLKIDVIADADRTPLKQFLLESKLEGIGEKRLAWLDEEQSTINPGMLVQSIRSGLDGLELTFGLKGQMAEGLLRLSPSKLMELEALELGDRVDILLNVSHDKAKPNFRRLDKLSTGQQCTAILHMLLLDNVDPLIMDQPEDNLDNAFIADRIVQELRAAKTSRQFLFATHNANIPVFGDAEWIGVFTTTDEGNGSLEAEAQGSIDVPAIRDQVASILEGGRDAFIQRKEKYEF